MNARDQVAVVNNDGVRIRMGGEEFYVRPLPIGKDRAWRHRLAEIMAPMIGSLGAEGLVEVGEDGDVAFGGDDLGGLLAKVMPFMLSECFDGMADLVFLYAPEMAAKRAELEANATVDEIVEAALQVFELAGGRLKKILENSERMTEGLMKVLG